MTHDEREFTSGFSFPFPFPFPTLTLIKSGILSGRKTALWTIFLIPVPVPEYWEHYFLFSFPFPNTQKSFMLMPDKMYPDVVHSYKRCFFKLKISTLG